MSSAGVHEPDPKEGDKVVYHYVLDDINERVAFGIQKHGGPLMTKNGRDPLWDAYQEAIDLVMYLRQAILERDNP